LNVEGWLFDACPPEAGSIFVAGRSAIGRVPHLFRVRELHRATRRHALDADQDIGASIRKIGESLGRPEADVWISMMTRRCGNEVFLLPCESHDARRAKAELEKNT
jgi:hypothetical protein